MSPEVLRAIVELRAAAFTSLTPDDVREALPETSAWDDDAIDRALAAPGEAPQGPGDARFVAWGRATVARLQEGSLRPLAIRPYLLRWLGGHMLRAEGDPLSRRRLITPAWRAACEAVFGDAAPLVDDLRRLDAHCAALEGAGGPSTRHAGTRWFCALALASARESEARRLREDFVASLVRAGLWSPRQGAAAVLRAWREQRFADLGVVGPAVGPEGTRWLFERLCALDDAETGALFALVEHLPEGERAAAAVRAIEHLRPRDVEGHVLGQAIQTVARLAEDARGSACEALLRVIEGVEPQLRGEAWEALAPLLDLEGARRFLPRVGAVDPWQRAGVVAALVKGREAALIDEGLAACAAFEVWNDGRARAVRALAPGLPPALVPRVFAILTEGEMWEGAGRFAALDAFARAGTPDAFAAAIAHAATLDPTPDGFDLTPWRERLAQREDAPTAVTPAAGEPPAVEGPPSTPTTRASAPSAAPPLTADTLRQCLRLGDDREFAAALAALAEATGDAAPRTSLAAAAASAAREERHPIRRVAALANALAVAPTAERAAVVDDTLAAVGEALTAPDATVRARRPRGSLFQWDPPPVEALAPPMRALLRQLDDGARARLASIVKANLCAHPSRLPATLALEVTAQALTASEVEAALAQPATWFDAPGGLRALAALRDRAPEARLQACLGAVRESQPNRATALRDLLLGHAPRPRRNDVPDLTPRADPAEDASRDLSRRHVIGLMLTWKRDAAPDLLLDLGLALQEVRALWP